MPSFIDLTNLKVGRLTAISKAGKSKTGRILWKCKCSCGNIKIVHGESLRNGNTKSCGCLHIESNKKLFTTHGGYRYPEHHIWSAMLQRCINANNKYYEYYGGRGITVCKRWFKFANFISDMGRRPNKKLTLERVNNKKGYRPDNCIWATRTQQARNQRISKTNTSGVKGVGWNKPLQKWVATITVNYRNIHLGYFIDINNAIDARKTAEEKYWNVCK